MTPVRRHPRLAPLALLPALLLSACTTSDTPPITLSSIELVPRAVTLREGDTRKLTAIGTYSDGSILPLGTGVTFSSAEPAKATVSADGTVTGVAAGPTTIIATAGSRTATCAVTVTPGPPRLLSIAVTPSPLTVLAGASQALTVTATFSSGPTADVTGSASFTSSDTTKATVSTAGVVTGVAAGPATITATYAGQTATTPVTVVVPVLQAIAVTPATATVAVGATRALTVTATYDVGPAVDVTSTATYVSSDTSKVTVSAAGVVTGVASGTADVTASFGGRTAIAAITVAAPVLQSIAVTPAAPTLAVGGTRQLTVTATYDVGPAEDVTGTATYTSSNEAVATVSATGLVTAVAAGGPVTITATFGGRTGTSAVTVTAISTTTGLVFFDDYEPGVAFSNFGGSALNGLPVRDTTPANLNPNSAGRASLRVEILGTGDFAGGTWFTSVPRDLRAFNALTFWAKASTANTLNVSGIGINATAPTFKAEALGFPLTGTWTKFIIPLPDPTKAVGVDGLFHFADGAKGYTIWFSDIQYENLPGTEVGPATGGTINGPNVTVAIDTTLQVEPAPNTVTFALPVIPTGGSLKNVSFRWFDLTPLDATVASIDPGGLITGLKGGATTISATVAGVAVPQTIGVTVTAPLAVPTTIAAAPTVPAANVISLFSSAYTNVPVDTWSTSWSGCCNTLVDPYVIPGQGNVKQYDLRHFVGIQFFPDGTNTNLVDAGAMTHFHVDVWTPNPPGRLQIQLVDFPGGTSVGGVVGVFNATGLATGSWVSLDIPLSSFAGLTSQGALGQILFLAQNADGSNGAAVVYVDNVYLRN